MLLHINLAPVLALQASFGRAYNIQSLTQRVDALALEVVNGSLSSGEGWGEAYPRRLRLKLPSKRLVAVLNRHGVAAFGVGRDVDVEADDAACVDTALLPLSSSAS